MYTVHDKSYDENSATNLAVKEFFVRREIHADVTDIVNYVLKRSLADELAPLTWSDDLDRPEQLRCPYCGEPLDAESETDTLDEDIQVHFDGTATPGEEYLCPVCFAGHPTEAEARQCCARENVYKCNECDSVVADHEVQRNEDFDDPQEWWSVSDWLGDRLAEQGELVLRTPEAACFWGRSDCQKRLVEDKVITAICSNAQILEGQENYREVKK